MIPKSATSHQPTALPTVDPTSTSSFFMSLKDGTITVLGQRADVRYARVDGSSARVILV
jgi:hypothetical protein